MTSFVKKHRIIIAALVLCLLSLHLASTNMRSAGGAPLVKGLLESITTPVQSALLRTRETIRDVWERYINLVGLKEQNESLKKDAQALTEENNRLKEELWLTARLKELLEFKQNAPFKTVAAEILGFNRGGGWIRTVTLNKGAVDGIREDMPLLTADGVVGKTVGVSKSASTGLLLTDPRSNIDVILQRTRVRGVLEGNGSDGLVLKYVRQLDDVQLGDRVITAGISGIFPKGMLVGDVRAVKRGEDNFFKYIEVQPSADLKKIEEVLIVIDTTNTLTQEDRPGMAD